MKYLFTIILSLLSTSFIIAQEENKVIHLKNGSIIKGVIIEEVPNKSIKIKTEIDNIFVFELDEIEKISFDEKNEIESNKNEEEEKKDKTFNPKTKNKGFFCSFEIGSIINFNNSTYPFETFNSRLFSSRINLGGRINSTLSLGAQLGYDVGVKNINNFSRFNYNIPIGVFSRINILKKSQNTPFIDFGVGYIYSDMNSEYIVNLDHHLYFSHSIGWKFWLNNRIALIFKAGYFGTLSFLSKDNINENFTFRDNLGSTFLLSGINVKVGIEF